MKVTWNSDSYAQFLEPVFRVMPDLKTSLLADFVSFKNGFYPAVFGKDGPYTDWFCSFLSCLPRSSLIHQARTK